MSEAYVSQSTSVLFLDPGMHACALDIGTCRNPSQLQT